jgi:hypothetical protein
MESWHSVLYVEVAPYEMSDMQLFLTHKNDHL